MDRFRRSQAERGLIAMRVTFFVILLSLSASPAPAQAPSDPAAGQAKTTSYKYYGPNKLWKKWNDPLNQDAPDLRLGRDTWIHWTWGNQKLLRKASVLAGNLPVPISIDYFRILDSRKRLSRFRDLGLINEPNCSPATQPDEYGFWLDRFNGDPKGYYPVDYDLRAEKYPEFKEGYSSEYAPKYPGSEKLNHYGYPTGIVGLRLFRNPAFSAELARAWKQEPKSYLLSYFRNPGRIEPPYLVGFSCAFCHMGFDPNNPPKDPENPAWENLAANIGNQYFREGEIFLGKGRILFGNKNPDEQHLLDPYQNHGLTRGDFLYHYAATQQPGTSETSRISYDFINNPNTINPLFSLANRPKSFEETTPWGLKKKDVMHILKDGADSIGIEWALMRVPINIGCEGDYWIDHLFDPVRGQKQKPFHIADVIAGWPTKERDEAQKSLGLCIENPDLLANEMRLKYPRSPYGHEEFGEDWLEGWRRLNALKKYLFSYGPSHLESAVTGASTPIDQQSAKKAMPAADQVAAGAAVFAEKCASCHSSQKATKSFLVTKDPPKDFRDEDFLSDDKRYRVTQLKTNMARSLGTNAIDADIWAEFSSEEYKALRPVGTITIDVPVFPSESPWQMRVPLGVKFDPPGGGRGYYRTPSLISMWATAPYLHNNSVGDYFVIDENGKEYWVRTDETQRRLDGSGVWENFNPDEWKYRIDVSVNGRLKMFRDGVERLLYPARRHRWVKRTSAASTMIPYPRSTSLHFAESVVRDIVRQELVAWLQQNNVVELADKITKDVDSASRVPIEDLVEQAERSLPSLRGALHKQAEGLAKAAISSTIDNLKKLLDPKLQAALSLADLEDTLRQQLEKKLKGIDTELENAARLSIPAGTPINLYGNLSAVGMLQAIPAQLRHRNDPRALAKALLDMNECPDLVEDSGHTYGSELPDDKKKALIEFLKTL
jgi:hypothetical protein